MKKQNEKGFLNIQLFAETPDGATTPSENGSTPPSIDYESEYKKMLAERDSFKAEFEKQKALKDKYASENADYKKKELDKMTDDEKKAKEFQDLIESNKKLEARLREIETKNSLIGAGFSKEEGEKLLEANFSINDINVLSNIIKEKVDLAVKSAKAELIKGTTPDAQIGKGTTNGDGKSDFQKYQEAKQKKANEIKLK